MPRAQGQFPVAAERPNTSFEQLCVRAYSTMSAAGSLPDRIAVLAPSSCANFTDLQNALALLRRQALQPGRLDVHGRPFDADLISKPRCTSDYVFAPRVRADAAKQRRLGLPDPVDRLVGAIRLNVFLDPIGRAAQRELAQRHQVALAEKVSRGALDLFGKIDLAGLEPRQQLVGRDIDQNDIVGFVEERIGDGFPYPDAGDAADDVVQALQMLDVERRENIDAGGQQLVDVLPALRMPRTRRVGMRQLVDQDQRGPALERRVEVEFGDRCALDIER